MKTLTILITILLLIGCKIDTTTSLLNTQMTAQKVVIVNKLKSPMRNIVIVGSDVVVENLYSNGITEYQSEVVEVDTECLTIQFDFKDYRYQNCSCYPLKRGVVNYVDVNGNDGFEVVE